jgi:GDP-L-fucose synthase
LRVEKNARIYVAGGHTLIGAALIERLEQAGYTDVLGRCDETDLTNPWQVEAFFATHRPEYVFLTAGRSGGIAANQRYPADLMRDNLLVECNVLHSAYAQRVRKLLYLASSCSYPRLAPQPLREDVLLTGPLEPTNEAYAVAKIAGIKLCQAYRQQYGAPFLSAIPANAFGPGDDFSLEESHVIAALLRKMHAAKVDGCSVVKVWGSGAPRREFVFAPELADACLYVMDHYDDAEPINLGSGTDLSIRELAEAVRATVGYRGRLEFDASKPDGMPRKALDSSKLYRLGWRPQANFQDALAETYAWFLRSEAEKELTHA